MITLKRLSCYRNADEIAGSLEGQCRPEDLQSVLEFLKPHDLMEEGTADHSSSVIVLTSDRIRRVWADLYVARDAKSLPQIRRTGTYAPWMVGAPLGFNDNVTDPDLQRQKCLPLTPLSAIEEAFVFYLKLLHRTCNAPVDISKLLGTTQVFGKHVHKGCESMLGNDADKFDRIIDSFEGAAKELQPGFKIETTARARLAALIQAFDLDKQEEVPQDPSRRQQQIRDFFRAFDSSVERKARDRAHFGRDRFEQIFQKKDKNWKWENVVLQGAGDLTMNPWNVAYIHTENPPMIIPENEPYTNRIYTCLIGWKRAADPKQLKTIASALKEGRSGILLGPTLALARVRIMPGSPYVRLADDTHQGDGSIAAMIDFAVYGKLVVRDGQVVAAAEMIDEFQDLRHVFALPNLNTTDDISKELLDHRGDYILGNERNISILNSYVAMPRNLFGQQQSNDVWLLEYALLADTNLRRLACLSKISVGLAKLGAPLAWIHFCLIRENYRPKKHEHEVQEQGDFTWDWSDYAEPKLVIRLRPASYPCTIVGIGSFGGVGQSAAEPSAEEADHEALFLLAWGHDHKRSKHSIWDCAAVLKSLGARYAIALDEGNDVFQAHIPNESANERALVEFQHRIEAQEEVDQFMPVPIPFKVTDGVRFYRRRSLRASIAFIQERNPEEE